MRLKAFGKLALSLQPVYKSWKNFLLVLTLTARFSRIHYCQFLIKPTLLA
jgi:hypothetical protein